MSDTLSTARAHAPLLWGVPDCRPPAEPSPAPRSHPPDQPALIAAGDPPGARTAERTVVLRNRWFQTPPGHLPDPARWSMTLTWALLESLYGQRPVSQLSRWVDEAVLGMLALRVGRRQRRPTSAPHGWGNATLRSLRLQCPGPGAVEVTAHLLLDGRSVPMAFRLQAWGSRWLCTALELAPTPAADAVSRGAAPRSSPA
jgi:hypothetical protein